MKYSPPCVAHQEEAAQYLPKLCHQRKTADKRGKGHVTSFSISLLGINLQPWDIVELFKTAQCVK